jgi:hypothetical protein
MKSLQLTFGTNALPAASDVRSQRSQRGCPEWGVGGNRNLTDGGQHVGTMVVTEWERSPSAAAVRDQRGTTRSWRLSASSIQPRSCVRSTVPVCALPHRSL